MKDKVKAAIELRSQLERLATIKGVKLTDASYLRYSFDQWWINHTTREDGTVGPVPLAGTGGMSALQAINYSMLPKPKPTIPLDTSTNARVWNDDLATTTVTELKDHGEITVSVKPKAGYTVVVTFIEPTNQTIISLVPSSSKA